MNLPPMRRFTFGSCSDAASARRPRLRAKRWAVGPMSWMRPRAWATDIVRWIERALRAGDRAKVRGRHPHLVGHPLDERREGVRVGQAPQPPSASRRHGVPEAAEAWGYGGALASG